MATAEKYHGSVFSGADAKGRFTLPVDMRRRVRAGSGDANNLFVAPTSDLSCIIGFGEDYITEMDQELQADVDAARVRGETVERHSRSKELVRDLERVTFDDGGRFALPPEMKEALEIGESVIFVGALKTFEIWQPDRFFATGQGSEFSRIKLRKAMEEWAAKPKAARGKAS
ncbi:MAG: division/cell wall cluster transcriptional repressor MraZ [Sphingobium sp.]